MAKKTPTPRKSGGLFKKIILILILCITLACVFFFGARIGRETAKPVITSELLGQQLRSVQELVSVEYYYTNMGKFENQVNFYGWKVPFTSKSFIVSYDGVIKAGIDFSRLQVNVNNATHTITITLPESEILSHEIKEDSITVFDESDNLFNHITIEDYVGFTQDQKESMAQEAIDNGLLTAADEKARTTIESFLILLPGIEEYTLKIEEMP